MRGAVVTQAERITFEPCAACGFRGLWPLGGDAEQRADAGAHFALHLVDLIPVSENWKLAELEKLLRSVHAGGSPNPVQDWLEREFAPVMSRMLGTRGRAFTQGLLDAAVCYNLTARGPFPDRPFWLVCGPRGVEPVWVVK